MADPKITRLPDGSAIGADPINSAEAKRLRAEQAKIARELQRIGQRGLRAEEDWIRTQSAETQQTIRAIDKARRERLAGHGMIGGLTVEEYARARGELPSQGWVFAQTTREIDGSKKVTSLATVDTTFLDEYQTRELAKIAKSDKENEYRNRSIEAAKIEKLGRQASQAWVTLGAMAITSGNIQTESAFINALARVQVTLNDTLLKHNKLLFAAADRIDGLLATYTMALQNLGLRYFTLWVNDGQFLPPRMASKERLRSYGGLLKDMANRIIYKALRQAVTECVAGLDPKAWPQAYTNLMMARINELEQQQRLHIPTNQQSIADFRISIDFDDMFGSALELQLAEHQGALLKSEDNRYSGRMPFGSARRVEIPFFGDEEKLKNPASLRYKFWQAISTNKRVFYGHYETKEKARKGRAKTIESNTKLKEEFKQDTFESFSYGKVKGWDKLQEKKEKQQAILDKINDNELMYGTNSQETRGFKIPPGLWKATIERRVSFWAGIHRAPVWQFLEFGQLRWAPVIPPRGLTYRFLKISRDMLGAYLRDLVDMDLENVGLAYHPSLGQIRAQGTPIMFGPKYGQAQRRGTFVSRSTIDGLINSLAKNEYIIKRNREEAARVAGVMPGPTIPTIRLHRRSAYQVFIDNLKGLEERAFMEETNAMEREAVILTPKGTVFSKIVRSPLKGTTGREIQYPKQLNFGQRMAALKATSRAKRQLELDRIEASSMGMDTYTYRKFRAREEAKAAKARERARIKQQRIREKTRAKARSRKKKTT